MGSDGAGIGGVIVDDDVGVWDDIEGEGVANLEMLRRCVFVRSWGTEGKRGKESRPSGDACEVGGHAG